MAVEMKIQGLMIDPITNMPIVVLRDPRTDNKLPIWVGVFEANAIALELERSRPPRPMTHDLLRDVLAELGARLERVEIVDLQDNVFFGALHVRGADGDLRVIDCRPSDAIALALRADCPIYARERVIEAAQEIDVTQGHEETEEFRRWLESLGEEELGKYEI